MKVRLYYGNFRGRKDERKVMVRIIEGNLFDIQLAQRILLTRCIQAFALQVINKITAQKFFRNEKIS